MTGNAQLPARSLDERCIGIGFLTAQLVVRMGHDEVESWTSQPCEDAQQDHRVEPARDCHQQSPILRDKIVVLQPRSDLPREIQHGMRLVASIPTGEPRDDFASGG